MRIDKWEKKAQERNMAANCQGNQSPPRAVELRRRKLRCREAGNIRIIFYIY
jgi:hypothetical protein